MGVPLLPFLREESPRRPVAVRRAPAEEAARMSAVAGALPWAAAMVRRMPRSVALTPSALVGGSWPASLWRWPMAAALRPIVLAFRPVSARAER